MRTAPLLAILLSAPALASIRGEFIDPQLTDPAMRQLTELPGASGGGTALDHYAAIDHAALQKHILVVWLPGSGGVPADYVEIANAAASEGFFVVSLIHPNWPAIETIQTQNSDPNVPEQCHRERLYGENTSPDIDVPPTDCIVNRLTKLLRYLDHIHPGEGWGRFLNTNGEPLWGMMVWGGHSQGGEHVGYLTRDHPIGGAVYCSSPGDFLSYNPITPTAWDYRPGLVPAARQLGFVHQREPAEQPWLYIQNLFGLDAFGPLTSVDTHTPPYGSTHELVTNWQPATLGAFHSSTAVDRATPRLSDGTPRFAPVWKYMFDGAAPIPCRADVDDGSGTGTPDGGVTIDDLLCYLTFFSEGDIRADVDDGSGFGTWDGGVTIDDLIYYLSTFISSGC